MANLSVNVNKIATLRNARGGGVPDLCKMVIDIQKFGADGITIHPRPDERHIKRTDVYDLKKVVTVEYNIEGFPDEDFIQMVLEVKPEQVTLVPDSPQVLTSNSGWDTKKDMTFLMEVIPRFKECNIRTSIFIEPDLELISHAKEIGTDRIELYTESYAQKFQTDREEAIKPFIESCLHAENIGLGVNAGHDLSLENLRYFKQNCSGLKEVSIGHALISDALYLGIENTVRMYKRELR